MMSGNRQHFRIAERIRFDGHVEAGVEIARSILNRLKFSRQDSEHILALIANHMRFKDVQQMRESTLKRFLRLPRFEEHLELHRVDCLSSHGDLTNWNLMREKMMELPPEQLRPARLLTGDDLIAAGFVPDLYFQESWKPSKPRSWKVRFIQKKKRWLWLSTIWAPGPKRTGDNRNDALKLLISPYNPP